MKRSAKLMLVLASAFSVTAVSAQVAPTDEQARERAAETVANATKIATKSLNTKRREDLEDALFSFQRKILGKIRRRAYFYDVVDGGYWVTRNEATYSTPSRRWLVAVSTDDGTAFGLEGFTDPEATFNKLMLNVGVDLNNASQAETFARFYLGAVFGNQKNIIFDEIRLRHEVEEHFVGYSNTQEPVAHKEQRYRAWWAAFKSTSVGKLEPCAQAEGNEHYRVTLKILNLTVGHAPELTQWSVKVGIDGTARLLDKHPVFPTKQRPGNPKGTY
jgi:hypothetical protein